MHLFISGTPRNDAYQTVENRLCTHRLFSLHGAYEKPVFQWVADLREGIFDANEFLKRYPRFRALVRERDIRRREAQKDFARTEDWDTLEVIEEICEKLAGRPYPKIILLDSGAFTAWNKGEQTTVDDVKRKYSTFLELADGLFDEVWAINLDVIPGERGRDPTPYEIRRAIEQSDVNFDILTREFGDVILPVFHQDESDERLAEVVEQVRGKSNYICVSPRNDLAERHRVTWSKTVHTTIKNNWPEIRTHGLATTGNEMVRSVPWFSGDSAAWVQHGGYGLIDIFHAPGAVSGKKSEPHYMNYFVSFENAELDLSGMVRTRDGRMVSAEMLGMTPAHKIHECCLALVEAGVDPGDLPIAGGHFRDASKSYFALSPERKKYVRSRVEAIGFPFESCIWDSRVRNLICLSEFVTFAEWAKSSEKKRGQTTLGGF